MDVVKGSLWYNYSTLKLISTFMKSKFFLVILAVIIMLVGGYYFYDKNKKQVIAPTTENGNLTTPQAGGNQQTQSDQSSQQPSGGQTATETPAQQPSQSPAGQSTGTFSLGEDGEVMAPDILVVEVVYDGSGFNPTALDIKQGDIVIFKNNSNVDFWPASDNHPTHTLYPEFDAKKPIGPGGSYQFTFNKVGSWGYHDHLNPAAKGVVHVTAK